MSLRSLVGLSAFLCCLLLVSCATVDDRPGVIIDGSFDEWDTTPPLVVDSDDAPDGFVDFRTVKVRHDRDAVYLMVHVGRIVTAQRLPGTISLLLDVDGESATGHTEHGMEGVDIALEFPLPNQREPGTPGAGIRLRALGNGEKESELVNAYSVGFVLAPVHAGNTFELRIDRRGSIGPTPPLFQGDRFNGKFVAVDLENQFVDETDVFSHRLSGIPRATPHADAAIDPLRRLAGTDFRIVFWNISRGAYIDNPEPFARVLSAIKPDIIVLDEVPPTTNADEVAQFLEDAFIMNSWNVYFGESGGDQRTVVASKLSVEAAEEFQMVRWKEHDIDTLVAMSDAEDAADRVRQWLGESVSTGGAIVTASGRPLLVVGLDLQCCGGYETPQDRRRIIEAATINEAVRATLASTPVDGVIVGGDLNLVGDPAVQSILGSDASPDGRRLQRVRALQIDGLTDATWANPDEPFVPGRLDSVLYSEGPLGVKRAFVFDSNDLTARWQSYYGVRAGDNHAASDHFPVVVDFQWFGEGRTER